MSLLGTASAHTAVFGRELQRASQARPPAVPKGWSGHVTQTRPSELSSVTELPERSDDNNGEATFLKVASEETVPLSCSRTIELTI